MQLESDSPEQGARVKRGGWRDSRRPYAVVALVVLVLLSFQTLNRDWSTDYWMYTATLGALRGDVRNPHHDMTGTDDPSERFTPYTVGLAAIGRETGLASVTLLELAAIANLILFLVAFELFVTELTGRRLVACLRAHRNACHVGVRPVALERVPELELDRFRIAMAVHVRDGLGAHRRLGVAALRQIRVPRGGWWRSESGWQLVRSHTRIRRVGPA